MSGPETSTRDASLRAWGDALRAARSRRRRLRKAALGIGILASMLAITIQFPPAPRLIWNASASAPLGLYLVSPGDEVAVGGMVVAHLPDEWRRFAAVRRYLPANVPLVKRVVAGPGDEVCALGRRIFVEGSPVAERVERDGAGRIMPVWQGCRRLRPGDLFLLMTGNPQSFDGRYFGITRRSDVIGPARLLWAR